MTNVASKVSWSRLVLTEAIPELSCDMHFAPENSADEPLARTRTISWVRNDIITLLLDSLDIC